MKDRDWQSTVEASNCPFEPPREGIDNHLIEVARLSISTLYLERIQTYPGHCILIFDQRHVIRIDELEPDEWRCMADDIYLSERAIMNAFKPDHINIASIGQLVPHLHWHIIPRYLDDPRWGGPIWTTSMDEMQKVYLEDDEYSRRVQRIKSKLPVI